MRLPENDTVGKRVSQNNKKVTLNLKKKKKKKHTERKSEG